MRIRRFLTHTWPGILALVCSIGIGGCNPPAKEKSAPEAESSEITPAPSKPQPVAEVEDSVFDFGTMEVGEQRDHVFTIRNIGSAKLKMEKGTPGCKCTSFEVDKLELEPGESTTAKVSWRIQQVTESFEQNAPLTTNDPKNPEIKLTIKGTVAQVFVIKPGLTWRTPPLGEPVKLKGSINSSVLDKFEITKIESSDPNMTVSFKPFTEAELNQEEMKAAAVKCGYTIEADIAANVPVGDFKATITIGTDAGEYVALPVEVAGHRGGPMQILGPNWVQEHMSVAMGTFPAKNGKKVTLHLFFAGKEELKFEEIVADPDYVKVSLEPDKTFKGKTQKYKLVVEIPPGERPATRNSTRHGSIKVKTNVPEIGEIHFILSFVSTQ